MAKNDVEIRLVVRDEISKQYKRIQNEIKRANRTTSQSQRQLAKDSQESSKKIVAGLNKAKQATSSFKSGIVDFAKRFGPAAVTVALLTGAIVKFGQAIDFVRTKTIEFEKILSRVQAILKPTTTQFKALSKEARRLGESTSFSASEAGQAFVELGKLGLTTNQILAATGDVLNIAAAAQIDLASAAELTAITMKQFGLQAEDARRITDVMSKSFTTSALDAEKFRESMKLAGPVANALGISLEKATGAIAELANAGISGSMAGTSLRRVMLELGDANSKVAKIIGKTKFETLDFNQKLLELQSKGLSPTQIKATFGLLASTSAGILINGADNVKAFGEAFDDARGSAQAMADTMLDNVAGATKILESAQEGLALAIGAAFSTDKRTRIELYTEAIQNATKWVKEHEGEIRSLSSAISSVLITSFNTAKDTIGEFANGLARVGRIIDQIRGGPVAAAIELEKFNDAVKDPATVERMTELRRQFDSILDAEKEVVKRTGIFGNTIETINPELARINEQMKELSGTTFFEARGLALSLKFLEDRGSALNSVLESTKELQKLETIRAAVDVVVDEDFVIPVKAKKPPKIPGARTVDFQKAIQDSLAAQEKLEEIAQKTNASLQLELLTGKEKELEILRRFEEEKETLLAAGGESAIILDQVISQRRIAILEAETAKRKALVAEGTNVALSGASDLTSALGNLSAIRGANAVKEAEDAGKSEQQIQAIRKKTFEQQKNFQLAGAIINVARGITAGISKGLPFGPIEAALAAATGAIQISAIKAQKFTHGGVVPGNNFSGDNVPALLNSGEVVLTRSQFRNITSGSSGGNQITFEAPIINIENGNPEVIARAVNETYQEMINNFALAQRDSEIHELQNI